MLRELPRRRLFAVLVTGAVAGLPLVATSPTLADPPEGTDPKQWKIDQLLFCMQSAAAAKRLFLKEMQKGCLSGAKRVPSDAGLCMMLTKPAGPKPKPTPGGVCAEPQPSLACTTCAPNKDPSTCSMSTAVSGSMSFEKTKDGEILVSTEEGSSFLIEGSYGGSLTTAHIAFQVKDSGHDGPFDLVSAVVDASFRYSESHLVTGKVFINGHMYYPPLSFSCGHVEKGEKWALSMHVDRDCTSPVNQTATPASTAPGTSTAPTPTAPPGTSTAPPGTSTAPPGTSTAPPGTSTAPPGTSTAPPGTSTAPTPTAPPTSTAPTPTAPPGTTAPPSSTSTLTE